MWAWVNSERAFLILSQNGHHRVPCGEEGKEDHLPGVAPIIF
jgi:hypothetical protein